MKNYLAFCLVVFVVADSVLRVASEDFLEKHRAEKEIIRQKFPTLRGNNIFPHMLILILSVIPIVNVFIFGSILLGPGEMIDIVVRELEKRLYEN